LLFTYVDSSALIKLIAVEQHSLSLKKYLSGSLISSLLARIEISSTIRRSLGSFSTTSLETYKSLHLIPISRSIAQIIESEGFVVKLKTLDAIHVASALSLGNNLKEVVTYDKRMQQACSALGIPFVAP
jgi:predicted nucleic acid-binding protein